MARPSKPVGLIDPKKTHHSKAEFEQRRAYEAAITGGGGLIMSAEVAADRAARALFEQLQTVFSNAGMDDALYSVGLNNYCLLQSEIRQHMAERAAMIDEIPDPGERWAAVEKKDRTIAKLRDQCFAWEKENLGTVSSKMRVIPKRPNAEEDSEKVTGIAAFMARREAK